MTATAWRDGERLRAALRVYVLTDRQLAAGRSEVEIARQAIIGGATAIQLRWKAGPMFNALELGRELAQLCRQHDVLFIVNDRVDLALALDAGGVHLGEHDLPVQAARRVAGDRLVIGYSPPTLVEAVQAERAGADYLGIGPIYATTTKADAGTVVGASRVQDVVASVGIPVIGIGGISADNAAPVIQAGACGVAVISSVVAAPNVELVASRLRAAVDAALSAPQ